MVECWVMGWIIRVLGFDSWQEVGIFLFLTMSRMALESTQPPIQGVKQLGCEVDHSPPSSAEVKECVELYLHSHNTPSWHGAQLKKCTETTSPFTFTHHSTISFTLHKGGGL
jgi:hypothetical protein